MQRDAPQDNGKDEEGVAGGRCTTLADKSMGIHEKWKTCDSSNYHISVALNFNLRVTIKNQT